MTNQWYMAGPESGEIFGPTLEAVLGEFDATGELGLSSDRDGSDGALLCTSLDPLSGRCYLVVREQDDPGESALIDPAHSQEEIEAIIGGQRVMEPQYRLVRKEMAVSAIRHFYKHGTRCPTLTWGSP